MSVDVPGVWSNLKWRKRRRRKKKSLAKKKKKSLTIFLVLHDCACKFQTTNSYKNIAIGTMVLLVALQGISIWYIRSTDYSTAGLATDTYHSGSRSVTILVGGIENGEGHGWLEVYGSGKKNH